MEEKKTTNTADRKHLTDENGRKLISRRTFCHKGMMVEELIFETDIKLKKIGKVMWCRPPIEHSVVDGQDNPIVHHDFTPPGDETMLELSRRRIREVFDKHYGLPTGKLSSLERQPMMPDHELGGEGGTPGG